MKRLLIISIFSIAASGIYAQTYNAFLAAADRAFNGKDYYSALVYYTEVEDFEKAGSDIDFKIAESARLLNSYEIAESYYQKVLDEDEENAYAMSSFWLANVYQEQGKYDEAKDQYQMYLSENNGDNPFFTKKAIKEAQACDWAKTIIEEYQDAEEYNVVQLGDEVNTSYTEFGAVSRGDTLYYSSLRFKDKNDIHDPQRPLSHILTSVNGEKGKRFEKDFSVENQHIAHTAINDANTQIVYTICEYRDISDIRCDLFARNKDADGDWGVPRKLGINKEGFTSTQPSLGINPVTGEEVLYFTSDRDGGVGNLDIWYSTISVGGAFSEPVNLSVVNTTDDDITPYYHSESSTLFFSSKGYQGLGGYDVYNIDADNLKWNDVEHMGAEINSSYNDVYYSLNNDGQKAYLSSNRDGAAYVDKKLKACCNDIYEVTVNNLEINLLAETFNKLTGEDLNGATVCLIDLENPDSIIVIINDVDNDFKFALESNKNYLIIGKKEGFVSDTIELNTSKIRRSTDITKKLYLKPDYLALEVLTFDRQTQEALNGATVRVIDLTDNTVEDIVYTHDDNNLFDFKLTRDHDYRIIASRKGYSPSTVTIIASEFKNEGKITKKLYLNQGDLGSYLPLVLFYDNDRPDRKTLEKVTTKTYTDTYDPYYAKKGTYKRIYGSGLSGERRVEAQNAIENFFENRVKFGKDQLDRFLIELVKVLRNGENVSIGIKGYASPIASTNYNELIAHRRVSSLRNEISEYDNGIFASYIESGQLTITEAALGELSAPANVSSSPSDVRNSIYSVEASEERRVEIIQADKF